MDLLTHLDLRVQRLIGHCVELVEHIVDSVVTGGLAHGYRRRDGRSFGSILALIHVRQPLVLPARFVARTMRHLRMAHVPAGLRTVVTADRRAAVGLVTRPVAADFFAAVFLTAAFFAAVFLTAAFFVAAVLTPAFFVAAFFSAPAVERADADRGAATSARSRAASPCASSSFAAGTSPRRVTAASTSPRTSAV